MLKVAFVFGMVFGAGAALEDGVTALLAKSFLMLRKNSGDFCMMCVSKVLWLGPSPLKLAMSLFPAVS